MPDLMTGGAVFALAVAVLVAAFFAAVLYFRSRRWIGQRTGIEGPAERRRRERAEREADLGVLLTAMAVREERPWLLPELTRVTEFERARVLLLLADAQAAGLVGSGWMRHPVTDEEVLAYALTAEALEQFEYDQESD